MLIRVQTLIYDITYNGIIFEINVLYNYEIVSCPVLLFCTTLQIKHYALC